MKLLSKLPSIGLKIPILKLFFLAMAFLTFAVGNAQILEPVKWTSRVEKTSDTEFTLVMEAKIDEDWHVYSQFTPDGGSLPIEMKYLDQQGNYTLVGKTVESKYEKQFNDVFGVDEYFFSKKFTLRQKVKITNPGLSKIEAKIDYQVCKQSCINGNYKFTFEIPKMSSATTVAIKEVKETNVANPVLIDTFAVAVDSAASTHKADREANPDSVTDQVKTDETAVPDSLWTIFFLAFLAGFAALLTPCVFPLIPMTVSFFTKQSKTKSAGIKNAIIYGISIIVIYVLLGSIVTAVFGADALNSLATNVWFNLIFFILLIIFAMSFLGAFEIMLPNSWANKVDKQADRGGIIGILFMALGLAIVSFSCTGLFVGNILVAAATIGGIGPIVGMFGFSLALALPFMLFAMFPGWLNSLPKSGGWLNTVKVFLGFLELALAFKFLSNADLVLQLHLLEREVFLSIWIAIFGALALYLLGKITMPHDSPLPFISVGRLMLGLLVLSFTVYLIPGLWGAPLKLINAFPPPLEYSESPRGLGGTSVAHANADKLPEGAKFGPHDIVTFDDYDKGLAYAKTVNKPILLDFTGFACVNCRKMENNVWSDERISAILNNDVVLISLYVDDKRPLPQNEQHVSKETGNEIESIGDKWTEFMINKYKTNTQPLYVLTDLEGNTLNGTTSYDPDIAKYETWLKTGISRFKK